jgi:hypothetical protein
MSIDTDAMELDEILETMHAEAEAFDRVVRAALAESGAEADAVIAAVRADGEALETEVKAMLAAVT